MAINFPNSPSNGDIFGNFTYDTSIPGWRKTPENSASLPAGTIVQWPGATAPANWLLCQGQAVSRTTYASLFAAIGVQYGSGDGTTTFNLPNLKGRVAVGLDSSQTEFDTLGETGGAKTHTLITSEIPAHTHSNTLTSNVVASSGHRHDYKFAFFDNNYKATGPNAGMGNGLDTAGAWRYSTSRWQGAVSDGSSSQTTESAGGTTSGTTTRFTTTGDTAAPSETTTVGITNASVGGGGAHNNLQPYIVLNYIIKTSAGITSSDSELATRVGAVESANNSTPLSANYVINGALDYWQRSTSATQAANSGGWPSADRFRVVTVGATAPAITLARSTDVPTSIGVQYSAAMSWSSNISGGDVLMHYAIENGKYLFAGKTMTVSFYAKAATAITTAFNFDQDYGNTSFSLTTSWTRYTYTITLPSTYATSRPSGAASNDNVELRFLRFTNVSSASNTIYFTGVQVEEGAYATPFRRSAPSLQAELAACQRYFLSMTPTNTLGDITYAMATATTQLDGAIRFPVTMRAAPALTVSSANVLRQHRPGVSISESTATGIVASSSSPGGAQIYTTGTGFTYGVPYAIQWTTGTGYLWFSADI